MSAFDDYFARMMPDAEAWFAEHAAEPVVARPVVVPEGEPLNPSPDGFLVPNGLTAQLAAYFSEQPDAERWAAFHGTRGAEGWTFDRRAEPNPLDGAFAALSVRKVASYIEVPDELLMDYGVIPDTRPKPPPPSWRWRLRNRVSDWRERTARRAFKIIAGYWPDNGDDW